MDEPSEADRGDHEQGREQEEIGKEDRRQSKIDHQREDDSVQGYGHADEMAVAIVLLPRNSRNRRGDIISCKPEHACNKKQHPPNHDQPGWRDGIDKHRRGDAERGDVSKAVQLPSERGFLLRQTGDLSVEIIEDDREEDEGRPQAKAALKRSKDSGEPEDAVQEGEDIGYLQLLPQRLAHHEQTSFFHKQ